jgi:hypothetical protein
MNDRFNLLLLFGSMVCFLATCDICKAQAEVKPLPFEARLVGALFNKQVQGELELVDEQKQEMKQILASLRKKQEELGAELAEFKNSGASKEEVAARHQDLVAAFAVNKNETMAEAMDVLLPHQQKRLRQAAVQVMMRESAKTKRVPTGVLVPEIREYLEIDDDQAVRIKKKATELQKQLAEKIKKLTEQAQGELLDELTESQKSKYKDLVGDPIKR